MIKLHSFFIFKTVISLNLASLSKFATFLQWFIHKKINSDAYKVEPR